MARDYEALTSALASRSEPVVVLSFRELDHLVGGLPASARKHQAWWSNSRSSQPHSRHWLDAGRRATPDFNQQRVRFEVGGEKGLRTSGAKRPGRAVRSTGGRASLRGTGEVETASVRFEWLDGGEVRLDRSDKLQFSGLPVEPGVYRFAMLDNADVVGVYIGESDSLARRMTGYRNPGPTQPTNQRLNTSLTECLRSGGSVRLSVVLTVEVGGSQVDLAERSARLLAENAALLRARMAGDPVENR